MFQYYSKPVQNNRLTMADWDEIIAAMVALDCKDYEIYSFIREVYDGGGLLPASESLPRAVFEPAPSFSKQDEAIDVKASKSDVSIDTNINTGESPTPNAEIAVEDSASEDGRSQYLISQILSSIPSTHKEMKFKSALDFGCAEGSITARLGDKLGIPCDKMFGADVREIPSPGFTFALINSEEGSISPESPEVDAIESSPMPAIASGSIDLINASMVFHHINSIKRSMLELRRIISSNGLLLVREHHCNSPEMGAFLDIVHGLYSLSWSTPIEWPNFIDEYEVTYDI
jgi:SAM-dependent methyltransferase